MRYAYSTDEENYTGPFDTIEEVIAEATAGSNAYVGMGFWVGEEAKPPQPEEFWHSSRDWLENVGEQDEYGIEAAEDWDRSTKEQREELEAEVREVMGKWLDRHKLRPSFFLVENVKKYVVVERDGEYAAEVIEEKEK